MLVTFMQVINVKNILESEHFSLTLNLLEHSLFWKVSFLSFDRQWWGGKGGGRTENYQKYWLKELKNVVLLSTKNSELKPQSNGGSEKNREWRKYVNEKILTVFMYIPNTGDSGMLSEHCAVFFLYSLCTEKCYVCAWILGMIFFKRKIGLNRERRGLWTPTLHQYKKNAKDHKASTNLDIFYLFWSSN